MSHSLGMRLKKGNIKKTGKVLKGRKIGRKVLKFWSQTNEDFQYLTLWPCLCFTFPILRKYTNVRVVLTSHSRTSPPWGLLLRGHFRQVSQRWDVSEEWRTNSKLTQIRPFDSCVLCSREQSLKCIIWGFNYFYRRFKDVWHYTKNTQQQNFLLTPMK